MLVDDHPSILWGLQKLIEGEQPKMQVVATASSCAAAVEIAAKMLPDVIVLDLDLTGESSAGIIPALLSHGHARVLIMTGTRDPKLREAAILLGASGLLGKEEPAETILKAIAGVHRGELWLDRTTTARIFMELARVKGAPAADPEVEKISSLTARERDIIRGIVNDPSAENRNIAEKMFISEHTMRNHVSRIYSKLGVSSRLDLYVYVQKHGLGKPTQ